MKLICPTEKFFSKKIKLKFKKVADCSFLNINQNQFNKIFYKYEIIFIRFNTNLPFKKNNSIKYILSPTTGTNHIHNKYFKNKKIKIITLKNKFSFLRKINATSEFTIFLILFTLRNLLNFSTKKKMYNEIHDKKIGIIGLGRIGFKVAKILKTFGAQIQYYDISKKIKKNNFKFEKLNKLIKSSDILTLHIPLNNKNKNFINKTKLNMMKKNVILINTSRGEIVNENDLLKHIKNNKNFKYTSDVIQNENLNKKENKIFNLSKKNKNVFFTPHVAGMTEESVEATDNFIYVQFLKSLKNERKA